MWLAEELRTNQRRRMTKGVNVDISSHGAISRHYIGIGYETPRGCFGRGADEVMRRLTTLRQENLR